MSLLDWIHDIGGKLRIVQVDGACEPSPDREDGPDVVTKSLTLAQLMREMSERDMQALSELPAELSVPFTAIFEAAGVITPPHGWDVEKLRTLLSEKPYSDLTGDALTQAVIARLDCDNVTAEDLARDAVGRDQAIDAFEEHARGKMQVRADCRRRKIEEMRAQVFDLEEKIRNLEEETTRDRQNWRAWHLKKTNYEKMMAGALACLLDRPIVTLDPDEE